MATVRWRTDVFRLMQQLFFERSCQEAEEFIRRSKIPSRVGDGSIIVTFDKTPLPSSPNDVVCPHFVELKWATGCRFNCSWCYLQGTLFRLPYGKAPHFKDIGKVKKHLKIFLAEVDTPCLLNSGELCDSLVAEGSEFSLTRNYLPLLSGTPHRILIVTKDTRIQGILEHGSPKTTVVSISINAFNVAERWERGAPPVLERIQAAQKLYESGFEIRVRIDPVVPVERWQKAYQEVVRVLLQHVQPSRITLGSLRGLASTIRACRDKSWVKYLSERSNWGLKIPFSVRLDMYRSIIDFLREQGYQGPVALCKETLRMWNALGLNWLEIKCNCIP